MCFLWHNKLLFVHSITKKYNFINIVKKCQNVFAQIFWDFAQIIDACTSCTPIYNRDTISVTQPRPLRVDIISGQARTDVCDQYRTMIIWTNSA